LMTKLSRSEIVRDRALGLTIECPFCFAPPKMPCAQRGSDKPVRVRCCFCLKEGIYAMHPSRIVKSNGSPLAELAASGEVGDLPITYTPSLLYVTWSETQTYW